MGFMGAMEGAATSMKAKISPKASAKASPKILSPKSEKDGSLKEGGS